MANDRTDPMNSPIDTADLETNGENRPTGATKDDARTPLVFSGERLRPSAVVYEVLEHDGGWAYRVSDTFSEPYPTRQEATEAAATAAAEHQVAGETALIDYQDEIGEWREELAEGGDRPLAIVRDLSANEARRLGTAEAFTLEDTIRRNPWIALVGAAFVGFVLGRR